MSNSLESWVDIDGIPSTYRSHHLRFFFSDFVEGDKFSLCHFLHRQSKLDGLYTVSASFPSSDLRQEFISRYHEAHWSLSEGEEILPIKVHIRAIKPSEATEKKPPGSMMPKGNVGTSTAFFKPLISSCTLPPKIISKLRLNFPSKSRKYGFVSPFHGPPTLEVDPDLAEGEVEEWDRHEALHDDVSARRVLSGDPDNVPGTKERTFEDEVEVTWEKGSSGLVFYTDASYWKEKECESKEADDWDVDMGKYEGVPGDKDSEDYDAMRSYYRRSQGKWGEHQDSVFTKKVGLFEKHTKGFGRKMMEKQGWTDGNGLGPEMNRGIKEPVPNKGQINRSGLGYRKSSLLPFMEAAKRREQGKYIISTVYDDPKDTDPEEKPSERNPDNYLKTRD